MTKHAIPLVLTTSCALIAFFLQGCSQTSKSDALAGVDTVFAEVDTVGELTDCAYPTQMEKVGQHIIVYDMGNPASALVAYDLAGKVEIHFAHKGHATNEVENMTGFRKLDDSHIALYKHGGILTYNVDSLIGKSQKAYSLQQFPQLPYAVQDAGAWGKSFVASVVSDSARFCFVDATGNILSYNECPDGFVDNKRDKVAVTSYAALFRMAPDKQRFCQGTYIGGMLETFAIKDGAIVSTGHCILYKSEYQKFDNGSVSWDKRSTIGFDDIYPAQRNIYTIMNRNKGDVLIEGKENPFGQSITVFDWNARPKQIIHVGLSLMCLCVDEEKQEAYAVHYGNNGIYLLHLSWG